tara:strand:- start:1315 stop:1533 length:219 start_codon:yes stop_codon:yes gene_type:complete
MKVIERKEMMLKALQKKYEGDMEWHRANINVYLSNPAGIGEHPDILEAINTELEKMVSAEEKIHMLVNHWEY